VDARSLALHTLREIYTKDAYADVALDRALQKHTLPDNERRLATELVYGTVRRRGTLDALITQLANKPADKQELLVRLILQLGLYQLRYLENIPHRAAVHTTVELARRNRLERASGFINGVLRNYLRLAEQGDPLRLPKDPIARIAVQQSYPEWLVRLWVGQYGLAETEALCIALNEPPTIDIRVNTLRATPQQVQTAFTEAGVEITPLVGMATGFRLVGRGSGIERLPGFSDGWWTVQDGAAQLVGHLVAPQAGETVIDACAAPGGKTLHLADLMGDTGKVIAVDRTASRLATLTRAVERLGVTSIQIHEGDSRHQPEFHGQVERVLLDAPCSVLGTLHRHADARWRQTPETIAELVTLQQGLLEETARWVKPGGVMVYATCTLNQAENEAQILKFLEQHHDWQIVPPYEQFPAPHLVRPEGWISVLPHRDGMDGFFMVKLQKAETG
jgi:16S rRNA (cytosine967-C5)-methyltransferase